MALNPIDLRIDTYSTGNRGFIAQPEIGVRITHIPTGIVAECSKYRSQHLNREEALGMLEIKLKETKVPSVPQAIAAVKTLEYLGYAYHSAEFWKPPVKPLEPSKPKMEAIAEVIEELENDGNGWCAKVRWLCNPVPVGEQLYCPKPQTSATVEQLVLLDATKYQMPEHTKMGTTFLNVFVSQADSQPAPQGETNAQLDIDSNHSTPGQQRDVAGPVALGQPVGNGSDQAAGHTGTQGDKLLIVAERNIRSFLRSAVFKSESDREAALNCVDVLWEAARAPADNGAELAEADRRAGAAERELASCREDVARFTRVRDQMKEQWGVDRNVSFDVVWAEALRLKQQAGAVPLTDIRKAALDLYAPPFRHEHGYIRDANHQMVADDAGSEGTGLIASRIRGWGRIQYMDKPEQRAAALQDEVAEIVAEALNTYWATYGIKGGQHGADN